ncbi:metallophosphoesterase [Mucilaginibacter sp. 21P]|uniref:metallophosphoesterase family protein n=1 Tax=Mucilaginibacter sp. 21P TaxID=2778902 RepID=UPI001C59C8DF|nr:metallophosphoesterase [Mucilaginibacter sp. 21P]QXV64241.1 metallophosphoesterase [Mucilaginibacter sp. 21P]
MNNTPLIFAHIGDLHITKAKEQNYVDMLSIVAQIETELKDQIDFVVLPGDNADNGKPEQYNLVAAALKMLSVPVYILAGDHDMEQGSLANFYQMPLTEKLPFSKVHKGNRCIFIDVCGNGSGGPDFRLGEKQFSWLEQELTKAGQAGETKLVFMHTFPSDLKEAEEQQKLNKLLDEHKVTLVDMGHTHYNEVANNGETIFTATRSTGQIEEGPVGYSVISVYNGAVSWMFKNLIDPFPMVLVNWPVDKRLLNDSEQLVGDEFEMIVTTLGAKAIKEVECNVGSGESIKLTNTGNLWQASINANQNAFSLEITATDVTGRPGKWSLQPATASYQLPVRKKDGSDADTIGAWPENGLMGTQLGPNSNAKPDK